MDYNFPKAELHLHLDGAISPATLFELAKERGVEFSAGNLEEFTKLVVVSPDCRDVNDFLTKFDIPTAVLQDAAALERVAFELVELRAKQGIAYIEIRFAPQLHTAKGMTQSEAIDAVITGIARGKAAYPEIETSLILCAMVFGPHTINEQANLETIRLTKEYLGKGVDACDLAGAEGLVPLSDFHAVFDLAKELNLPYTCHAGDSQGPDTVSAAIREFGSKRIGHGHHIFDDKELSRLAIDLGVTLEVCPTSNIQCQSQPSFAEHPIKKLFDMGMRVTVSTDNPVISGTDIDNEYDILVRELGFTRNDLIKMNIYAFAASFMPQARKVKYIEKLYRCMD